MTAEKISKRPDHMQFSGRILFLTEDTSLIRRQLEGGDGAVGVWEAGLEMGKDLCCDGPTSKRGR